MLKKIGIMAVASLIWCDVNAYQNGEAVGTNEIFSETRRITVNDVEYLYTFKGFQSVIVTNINNEIEYYHSRDIETQFVIERAIPLTGNYNIEINVLEVLGAECVPADYFVGIGRVGFEGGLVSSNFYSSAATTVVIGDSCFENNELVESVSFVGGGHWESSNYDWEWKDDPRKFRISRRSFFGAKNLKAVFVPGSSENSVEDGFKNFQLISIGESAFEGCTSLRSIGFSCEELERIEANAFKDCISFNGIVSNSKASYYLFLFHGMDYDAWGCMESEWWGELDDGQWGNYPSEYLWDTPMLKYIGESAFYNAGSENYSATECLKWTFGKNDINIEANAFYSSEFLREIHFPIGMERIVENSFAGLNKERDKCQLYLPDSLVSIGNRAFYEATVQVMKWPSALREIGDEAFAKSSVAVAYSINSECTAVITNIQYKVFNGLPTTLTKLGIYAFDSICYTGTSGKPIWSNGKISHLEYSDDCLSWCGPLYGSISFPLNLKSVPYSCFSGNPLLENIILHDSVTNIDGYAFQGCSSLNLIVPISVCEIGYGAAHSLRIYSGLKLIDIPGPKSVIFEGKPPKGIVQSGFLECPQLMVSAEYAADWAPYFRPNMKFGKKVDGEWVALGGKVISNAMRPSDLTIMDIKYKVTSTKDKVNVRMLAFEDGNRSFAKVLRPETFVDGTEANVGDGVTANVEHTVSWQVSKDWDVDLAKVSIEVYVQEDNLLPLQLTTIPAMGERAAVSFSRNVPDRDKVMNALYWLYADKAADLTLANGVLKCGNTQLVNGSTLSDANAVSYVYSKMGYGTLSGDTLKYVNELMRTNLNPSGITQYAVKEGAEQ